MSEIRISLDPVALREATTQAIMGILTPEVKAQVIQEAIRSVLAPSTNGWDKGKSPLTLAFEGAVHKVAREVIEEQVVKDESIRARLSELLSQAKDKLLKLDQEDLGKKIADAFVASIEHAARNRY
jgi:ethanolamine ammonia-lyase small subunit